ncbi:hypothetical protein GCM10009828_034560 [Actinoplanes couchii]|uniref:Ricin B lectin domain-containing protein n=2 Tax=Actinoplanes couchii TaxID=403638 RepID=A0ABQ3X8Y9_9ACTN|nr:hypothetical protein Aco03nite_033230 [Actinoplanes couchii]
MAMLVVTIGLSLSAMLLPVILRQVTGTRTLVDRNTALNGAQIGLDVVMARVRAASTLEKDKVVGQLEDMPGCNITGDAGVDDTGESLRYIVTIVYKDQDGKTLACPLTKVPTTALVTSQGLRSSAVGTDTSGSRSLSATYVFSTSNTNIPGGSIQIASSSVGSLCFDAGSKTPTVGTALVVKTCNAASTQQFGYTADLYLKLVNSESTAAPDGLCLYAGTSHANNNALTLQKCPADPATREPLYQWSLDGSSLFHSTSASAAVENFCINMKNASTIGSAVILNSCSVNSTTTVWRSSAGVGAGMAGDDTNQLVNYSQFSRCLDVTNQDAGYSYMIAWFCKQHPQAKVDWNQIWVHPVPVAPAKYAEGPIQVTSKDGKTVYCLKSPLSTASNAYATTQKCPTNPTATAALKWTVFHDTGLYATSYRIMDSSGFCLQPTDLNASPKDTHSDGTSKVKVEKCSSSELQKWNAPANISKLTPLTDIREN